MSEEALRDALAGPYALEREIGRGGMATVWLARDLRHDRPVAVKVLQPHLAATVGKTRFLREIRLAARLEHPHILPVFDSGAANDLFWYVTPYLGQGSLRDLLRSSGPLPVDHALRLAGEMAGALAFAHSFGIVHRDVKPENVLIADGHALLADFGIAHFAESRETRLTDTGHSLGTPAYMSPEQAAGERQIDGRTDIYALGAVLYEMLTGQLPYTGPSARAILALQMKETPRLLRTLRPDVPERVEAAVHRALAQAPADRFETASVFASVLDKLRHARPSGAHRARAGKGVWAFAGAGIVALVALFVFMGRFREAAPTADEQLLAILPFSPSIRDTALVRLGRDLVFTLSATLDGVGPLRTVSPHTVLALVPADSLHTLEQGASLARRLGAGRVLEGSLVREGSFVRATVSLYQSGSLARVAQATQRAAADSIARLTDSLGASLLQQALPASTAVGLASTLRTQSVPALRAFLEGEQLLSASRPQEAIEAYARAFAADSNFLVAAARLRYAMSWALVPEDPKLDQLISANLDLLPPREQMDVYAATTLVDSQLTPAMTLLRALVAQEPSSWFRWLALGDALFHFGPLQGVPIAEAKAAFDHTMQLNPRFVPGGDHALMLDLLVRDTAGISLGMALFNGPGKDAASEYGHTRVRFDLLTALVRGDSGRAMLMLDSVVADKLVPGRSAETFYEPLLIGLPAWQVKLEERVLQHSLGPTQTSEHRVVLAQSLAARGAWESALAPYLPRGGVAYRLAVLGMAVGAVSPDFAAQVGTTARERPLTGAKDWSTEMIWLDGVVAARRRDTTGLRRALSQLAQDRSTVGQAGLRLLRPFLLVEAGKLAVGAESLSVVDHEFGESLHQATTETACLFPVTRLELARWLDSLGQGERADSARRFIESPFFVHGSFNYNSVVAPYVWLERARRAERRGDPGLAVQGYTWFVRAVDLPDPSLRSARDEATRALARLASRN